MPSFPPFFGFRFLAQHGLHVLSVLMLLVGSFFWFAAPQHEAYGQTPQPQTDSTASDTSSENPETAEGSDSTPNEVYQENLVCILELGDDVAVYDADMIAFLEQHYLAENPASELVEVALVKFTEYRTNMRTLVTTYQQAQLGQPTAQEFQEYEACKQFVDEHIVVIEAMMKNQNVRNAGGKVSYQLVEKLKAINGKLRDLNDQFTQMYGAFKTFSDKLPGTVP